jgi:hypothetical protein
LHFFKYAARLFTSRGFSCTIHYAPPAAVSMYERLGYRIYSGGFTLASSLYRIPMILVAADAAYLARVHSAFSEAIRGLVPTGDVDLAYNLLPELRAMPLCARNAPEALAHVRSLCRNDDSEQTIPEGAARPIRRAALLRLRKGDAPVHAGDKPLLWFVLSGTCEVHCRDKGSLLARAGCGINAYAKCSFIALEDSDVLAFGDYDPFGDAKSMVPAPRFWQGLLTAPKRQRLIVS